MKHLGDIQKINGAEIPVVDIISFGAPCQDLSVAGLRKGMLHEDMGDEETTRSGLFFEAVRVIKEMRDHDRELKRADVDFRLLKPRYAIYENVPGALSSGKPKGADFQAVLTELCKIVCKDAPNVPLPDKGRWPKAGFLTGVGDDGVPFSVAYRVHDSQFWGIPQRRRRICVLCDFNGLTAGEILFDSQFERVSESGQSHSPVGHPGFGCRSEVLSVEQGLSGNPQSSKQARQTVAGDSAESLGESDSSG